MPGYNSAFAEYYDSLIGGVDYKARAAFFLEQIERLGGKHSMMLDLACGTGTLSAELAARGVEMIAVDGSPEMLSKGMEKFSAVEPRILFLCQDLEHLDLYGTVEAAVCMQDSLNHLRGEKALSRAFHRLKYFVEPGGLFLFDMNTPYKHQKILGNETFVFENEKVFCVWQNRYDEKNGAVDVELDFFEEQKDGRYQRSYESFREYSYPEEKIRTLLEDAQFELLEVQGDYTGLPPKEDEQRLVYLARRK